MFPKALCCFLTTTLLATQVFSQGRDTVYLPDFGGIIQLDSIMVLERRRDFNAQDFMKMIREDQSFYKAFKAIRSRSYQSSHQLEVFHHKNKKLLCSYQTKYIQQESRQGCYKGLRKDEIITGKFRERKSGEHQYYTAELHESVFLPAAEMCQATSNAPSPAPTSKKAHHIQELKKLIFSPGEKADVPLIGGKTALFEPDMQRYYDYSISSGTYNNKESYIFKAVVKPEYQSRKTDKTVIKYLETWIEKKSLQVLARKYHLFYKGMLFDFDVHMHIRLTQLNGAYLPAMIDYQGRWDVPFQKPEVAHFNIEFTY